MKGFFKYCFCIVMQLCIAMSSLAQDFKNEYVAFFKSVNDATSLVYDFNVTVYSSTGKVIQNEQIHFEKSSNAMYYKTKNIEYFLDNAYSIMLFKSQKQLMWSHVDPTDFDDLLKNPSSKIISDTIFNAADSIVFRKSETALNTYDLYYSNTLFEKISIGFDKQTNSIRKIIYVYKKDNSNSIAYTIIEFDTFQLLKKEIDLSKKRSDFIVIDAKKIKINPAFSGYSISETSEKLYIE